MPMKAKPTMSKIYHVLVVTKTAATATMTEWSIVFYSME